jgi:type I restriction enzyme S subunit
LPNIWQWVKFADLLVALESGKRPKGGAIGITEGIPSLSAEHMDDQGKFKFNARRFVPYEFYNEMPRGHIQKNDILIVKDGATTGKAAFVDDSFPFEKAVVNEHVFICRPNTHIVDPKYLFLFLWGENGQRTIGANFRGSAIGGINSSFVNEVYVPLPPLNEQRRIVAILNEKLVTIDRARAAAEAQLEAVRSLPGAYLHQVFDSSEAEKWPKKRLGDANRLLPAKSIALAGDTEVTTITTACLTEAGFNPDGLKPGRMWAKDAAECVVSKGEILIARSNTSELVGRVAMFDGVPAGVVASDLTIRVWPCKEKYHPEFLAFFMSSLYLNGYWRERSGGASHSMKKITRRMVSEIQIPTPNIEIQKKIVVVVNEKINRAKQVSESLKSQLDAINALSGAYLGQAFKGEL